MEGARPPPFITFTIKIETEVKDVDRIQKQVYTQHCPGSPSEASHSHNIIYYSPTAEHPPLKKGNSEIESSVQDNPAAPTIEIDTLEYQQTEKIETELKDVDRIPAYRCTQLCPGCPSGASHSHNTIYYYPTADSPPLRILPRWRVLYRITRQLLHCARCGSFSQKIETAS